MSFKVKQFDTYNLLCYNSEYEFYLQRQKGGCENLNKIIQDYKNST